MSHEEDLIDYSDEELQTNDVVGRGWLARRDCVLRRAGCGGIAALHHDQLLS
jgi:hypothetical protein